MAFDQYASKCKFREGIQTDPNINSVSNLYLTPSFPENDDDEEEERTHLMFPGNNIGSLCKFRSTSSIKSNFHLNLFNCHTPKNPVNIGTKIKINEAGRRRMEMADEEDLVVYFGVELTPDGAEPNGR